MVGRRGARPGRGWDPAPPRARRASRRGALPAAEVDDAPPTPRPTSEVEGALATGDAEVVRDEWERAREICLRQLAVRPRTRAELAAALARRGIAHEVAERVLDRYGEVGMIDDAAFARAWVSSRHHGRGLARRALARELRQRGVDDAIVEAALSEVDEETEAATARELVDRKLRSMSGTPDVLFRRLVGMLARKGYAPALAIGVVKEALARLSGEAAEFAEQIDVEALADVDEYGQ
ncbi:MAG TPA: regulatory protein RecX [Micromonospora sp.]